MLDFRSLYKYHLISACKVIDLSIQNGRYSSEANSGGLGTTLHERAEVVSRSHRRYNVIRIIEDSESGGEARYARAVLLLPCSPCLLVMYNVALQGYIGLIKLGFVQLRKGPQTFTI